MITLFTGSMGSGKTYTAVQQILLPNLRDGRTIVTNITGLDADRVAEYLKKPVEFVRERLISVDDEEINDDFWPTEDGKGRVPHGAVLILDEAWKFMREKAHLTTRLMDYIRRHRKWAGGDPPLSSEIVLITQAKTDLHRLIHGVTDQIYVIRKNRFLGAWSNAYQMALYQPGQRQAMSSSNHRYDKRIYPLFKSHNSSGVIEQSANKKGSVLHDRKAWLGAAAILVSVIAVPFLLYKLLTGTLMPAPHGPRYLLPGEKPADAAATSPFGVVKALPEGRPANSSVSLPLARPAGPQIAGQGVPAPIALAPADAKLPPPSYKIQSFLGDPDAISAVGKAFCGSLGKDDQCTVVVNASTSQVVIVGQADAVSRVSSLLNALATRPWGRLVRVVIFELDTTKESDLNFFLSGPSVSVGANNGTGVVGIFHLGAFEAGLQHLAGTGALKVVSAPSVMIWPGQTATVKSALSVPILGSIIVSTTGLQTQVLDYRDAGIILNLSEVSTGERPVLKVDVESSSYGNTVVGVTSQPTKESRVLSTMAELPKCSATLLGGLEQQSQDIQKQTFLGLPYGKTAQDKATRVFVAIEDVGDGSAGHACPAAVAAARDDAATRAATDRQPASS